MKLQQITLIETPCSFDVKAKALGKSVHAQYQRAFKSREEAESHIEHLYEIGEIDQKENKQYLKNIRKYGGKV